MDLKPIMTTKDIMQLMGWISPDSVYRRIARGELRPIPRTRPHRFTREAVEAFLKSGQHPHMPIPPARRAPKATGVPAWMRGVKEII